MKPSILTLLCSLSLVACGVDTSGDDPDLGITQDELRAACSSFTNQLTCNQHSHRCLWFQLALGAPCQITADGGVICPHSSGSCVDKKIIGVGGDGGTVVVDGGTIGGGGGGSDGGVVGGCACPNGDVCVNQIGGPATQIYPPPPTLCVAPVSPCASSSVCGCLPSSQGKCSPAPNVSNLCVCDNGIR